MFVVAGLVVVGCSAGGSRAAAPDTTAPSSTPTLSARQQAKQAYLAMWRDMVAAARTSNYRSPRLDDHATGVALSLLRNGLRENRQKGIVSRGDPVFRPRVTKLTPRRAVIDDCADDTHWLEYHKDGSPVGDGSGGHRHVDAVVVETGQRWKVSKLTVQGEGTCGET